MASRYGNNSDRVISVGSNSIRSAVKEGDGSRVVPLSFPATKSILWDHREIGPPVFLHLNQFRNPVLVLEEKSLRIAHRFAEECPSDTYTCHLTGSLDVYPDGEGVCLRIEQFNAASDWKDKSLLPGDLLVPCLVKKNNAKPTPTVQDFTQSIQSLYERCRSKSKVDLSQFVALRAYCSYHGTSQNFVFHIDFNLVTISTRFRMVPVNMVPIVPTALSKNLSGPLSISEAQGEAKSGYLTMDQTRKLLLILESDPKVTTLALVGIWISGVTNIHDPFVWASCLRYVHNTSLNERVCLPPEPFLVVLFSPLQSKPMFFQCNTVSGKLDMGFRLSSCHDVIQLPKNCLGRAQSPLELELVSVEGGGEKLELFEAALENNKQMILSPAPPPRPPVDSRYRDDEDDDITPRTLPTPHLTKAHAAAPAVPEVSLIWDEEPAPQHPPPPRPGETHHRHPPRGYGGGDQWYSRGQHPQYPGSVQSHRPPNPRNDPHTDLHRHYSAPGDLTHLYASPHPGDEAWTTPQYHKQAPRTNAHYSNGYESADYSRDPSNNQHQHEFDNHDRASRHHPPTRRPYMDNYNDNHADMNYSPAYSSRPMTFHPAANRHVTTTAPHNQHQSPKLVSALPPTQRNRHPAHQPPRPARPSVAPRSDTMHPPVTASTPHISPIQAPPQGPRQPSPRGAPHTSPPQQYHHSHRSPPQQLTPADAVMVTTGQSPVSCSSQQDSGFHHMTGATDLLNESCASSASQVPPEVYDLIKQQAEQLNALREQIAWLTLNSQKSSTAGAQRAESGTQMSNPTTPAKPRPKGDTCSIAVNTTLFQSVTAEEEQVDIRDNVFTEEDTDLEQQQQQQQEYWSKDNLQQDFRQHNRSSRVVAAAQQMPQTPHTPLPSPIGPINPNTSQQLEEEEDGFHRHRRTHPGPHQHQDSFGELRLSERLDHTQESVQSDLVLDLPAYASLSPDKYSECVNDTVNQSLVGESVSMYDPQDEELDDSGRGTGDTGLGDSNPDVSLLFKDQHLFYKNLMGNINKLLVPSESPGGRVPAEASYTAGLNDTIHTIQSDPGPSRSLVRDSVDTTRLSQQEVDVAEATRQQLLRMGIGAVGGSDDLASGDKSRYEPSFFLDPSVLPRVSYVSMFLDSDHGSADTSADLDSLAMKYLTDEQLSELHKLRLAGSPASGMTPQRRRGDPAYDRLTRGGNVSTYGGISPNNMTIGTKKYLERYGLLDSDQTTNTQPKFSPPKIPEGQHPQDLGRDNVQEFLRGLSDRSGVDLLERSSTHSSSGGGGERSGCSCSHHSDNGGQRRLSMNSDHVGNGGSGHRAERGKPPPQSDERVLDIERLRQLPKLL